MTTLLSARALACRRGDRLVFAGLDLALGAEDALLLVGPNGSGKSSLLRLLAGLLRPERGEVLWAGAPVADDPAAHRARLRFLGHLDAVKPALAVAETLRLWARLLGTGGRGEIDAALSAFALESLADAPCRFLSAGQKRRVALAARLLAAGPAPLWLLDEPTTALDRASVGALEAAIAAHRAAGGIVVLSTHTTIALPDARTLDLGGLDRSGCTTPDFADADLDDESF